MATDFRGTGGPPPASSGTGGSRFKKAEYSLSEPVGKEVKKVSPFMIRPGEEVQVVTLDGDSINYTVRLHTRFKANGLFNNHAVCIKDIDPRGCPLCEAIEPGKWFAVATVLDGSKWEIPSGKRKGEVITDQRRMLLINSRQYDTFQKLGSKTKGWRGRVFDVLRANDEKSARIGTQWLPAGVLTEEQLLEKYAGAAKAYGLPVATYVQPLPYDVVLKPLSREKLEAIANSIKAAGDASAAAEADSEEALNF